MHSSVCNQSSNLYWPSAALLEEGVFAILIYDFLIWLSSSAPIFSCFPAKNYCKITFPLTEILSDSFKSTEGSSCNKRLFEMSTSGRGRSVSFSSVALGMSALWGGGPTLRSSGSIQLHTMFLMCTFSFVLLFYVLVSFFVVLTIFWEWERQNEVWWIGRLGRSGRNWERGKIWLNTSYEKE